MYLRTTQGFAHEPECYDLGKVTASSQDVGRRFKRVNALMTKGLKIVKGAIPQLSTTGKPNARQALLRFMMSLLDSFFPQGHGLIDVQAKVIRNSRIGRIEMPVIAKDGSRWPFEHRIRLYLSDQIGFRKSGEHLTGHFSSVRLFTRELYKVASSRAVLVAIHEIVHMMFAMIRRFEHRFGAEAAARLLSREPWRLLDLRGFATHRERLEWHIRDLLRVLPIPMQPAELAESLIEEAFAAVFEVIVDEAIARSSHAKKGKRGPVVLPTYDFSPKKFILYYVLERGFAVSEKQLESRDAQQIFERMTKDVAALAASLRAHLDR